MKTKHAELYRRIAEFDFDEPGAAFPFTAKLAKENGWSAEFAKRVVEEYRRFAFLAVAAGHPVSPSEQVDQAWHLHLTYTRSYWERFCPEVLGRPLHHNPSKGGAAEQTKFVEWYNRTLESYRRMFGHEPPADIWPDAATRFGEDLQYRRVNAGRNWIVPKGPLKWLAAATALLIGLSALAGCVSTDGGEVSVGSAMAAAARIPNPLDLPGRQFLVFFAVAFVVAVGIAAIIRWHMRRPPDKSAPESLDLDPYEVAYLAGGEEAAVNAAIASLVSRKALNVNGEERRLSRKDSGQQLTEGYDPRLLKSRAERKELELLENLNRPEYFGHRIQQLKGAELPGPLHPLEEGVFEAVEPVSGARIDELHRDWPPLAEIAERLQSLGLIVSVERDGLGRLLPTLVALIVPLFGAIKIMAGVSRDKPVAFLVIGCVIAVIVAFAAFGRRLLRTWEGDRVLERIQAENAHLRDHGEGSQIELAGPALALALGLFGIGMLEGGPYAELHAALKPRNESAGWGGGDGGCGGGCGGCGGCG